MIHRVGPNISTPAAAQREFVSGADTAPFRAGMAFPAVIGEYQTNPNDAYNDLPKGYDWRPSFFNLDRTKLYGIAIERDAQGHIVDTYWKPIDQMSLAFNTAERWAYESKLDYPKVPAGMPVIMYCSWFCNSAEVAFAPPGGYGPTDCTLRYWFYHWVDPRSKICTSEVNAIDPTSE